MFRLTAKIEIRSAKTWVFDKVASVEITRDIETLTDTCVLQLPKKVKWQGESTLPIKRGDEVITVAAGFPTTIAPIVQYGAVPVFVDVELGTANIDASQLEAAWSPSCKASSRTTITPAPKKSCKVWGRCTLPATA